MKNNIFKLYTIAFYLCFTLVTFAQPGAEDTGGTGNLEAADPAAPIGDYIWVMAGLGLLFVFLKFRAIYKRGISS